MNKPLSLLDLRPDELRPMTEGESKMLITLTLSGQSVAEFKEPKTADQLEEFFSAHESKMPFLLAVLVGRLKLSKGKFSPDVVLLTAGLSSTPGEAVMWAYTLHLLAQQQNIGINELVMGPFGDGFPTDKGIERIWDAQKNKDAPLGNLLDSIDTWKEKINEKAD
jgi:hypothetical protein